VLRQLSNTIGEQERLISVLRQEGRTTKHAEELLASFKDAQAALAEYKDELETRLGEEQPLSVRDGDEFLNDTIQVTFL